MQSAYHMVRTNGNACSRPTVGGKIAIVFRSFEIRKPKDSVPKSDHRRRIGHGLSSGSRRSRRPTYRFALICLSPSATSSRIMAERPGLSRRASHAASTSSIIGKGKRTWTISRRSSAGIDGRPRGRAGGALGVFDITPFYRTRKMASIHCLTTFDVVRLF